MTLQQHMKATLTQANIPNRKEHDHDHDTNQLYPRPVAH